PFTAADTVSHFLCENDAASQQSRNLLENYALAFAFNRNCIPFVALGAGGIHGIQVLAMLVPGAADNSRNRRTVHVNVEHVKKDADVLECFAIHLDSSYACDLTI